MRVLKLLQSLSCSLIVVASIAESTTATPSSSTTCAFLLPSSSRRSTSSRTTVPRIIGSSINSNNAIGENSNKNGAAASPTTVTSMPTAESSSSSTGAAPEYYVRCGRCQAYYSVTLEALGLVNKASKGCRLECSVCQHSWFQSKERVLIMRDGFELVPLPPQDLSRIALNLQEGKPASFTGQVKLYVGNIAFECRDEDIYQLFSSVGDVGEVSLVRDDTGKARGFGFVTMRSKEDGQRAVDTLDGISLRGRNVAVRESNN